MFQKLSIVAAGALVILPGLIQGLWTGRWEESPDLKAAVARLEQVPMTIGDWEGQAVELDRKDLERAELAGNITRRYENQRTGKAVVILLMCGRPGPVAVHTPDVCYRGAGYDLAAPPIRYTPGTESASDEFWTARFLRADPLLGTHRRIFWTWSATGSWEVPDNPRLAFARFPVLYKLYVIREMNKRDEPLEDDPCKEFIQQLLPELRKALFPSS